ncbi:MAG: hypothetical protein K9J37_03335 [Saprospiraceae bacterium]|nr:hypothetical protein [Saprospiraceae bacterium]MCF8248916.1 hypothetical protein [Saprospiraceae bacterium]MCF8279127.1 hypothetical protein [Bacteroidales bacterium]MCF8310810.1 hypothetical protein [Saprospiraceae bacterium]MCF8439602.1 hypothetical protein [Saprospiraceae bacterium]
MNLFGRLFGTNTPPPQPSIRFGRFTDSNRSTEREEAFDAALRDFDKENYLSAYVSFFNYLLDEEEQNVRVREERGELHFEFFQGSKKITGFANDRKLYAEAKIAKAKSLQSSFMRRLLEVNYELKYSRFTLSPDNEITIVFDTYTSDGSPYKLYAALKELATHADKHDDILVDEFEALEITDLNIRRVLPDWEKKVKYDYIQQEIRATFNEIDTGKLNTDQYPVAVTYLLLHLCYKLDYLTKPEGYMMEVLEHIHRIAFAQDGKNASQKNLALRKEFQKLLDRQQEKFFHEMYEVSATFGTTPPIDHQNVAILIDQELPNMRWYADHGYEHIAVAVPGFIIGRALFNFALPPPDKALFNLLMQIMEADYFNSLGFEPLVVKAVFNEKNIRQSIRQLVGRYKNEFPKFRPDVKKLVFSSMPDFSESFLLMVRELDLAKV